MSFINALFLWTLMTASAQCLRRWTAWKLQLQADPLRQYFGCEWSQDFYY